MPVNYDDVLRDLDEQIEFHEAELKQLKEARPAIVILRNKFNISQPKPYEGMGAKASIRELLNKGSAWYRVSEIEEHLVAGGWKSDASDKARTIAATLSQMKDELDRQGDMWRAKKWAAPVDMRPGAVELQ